LKIGTSVALGLLTGGVLGLVGMGTVVALNPRIGNMVDEYGWWIVLLSMLVPLADFLTGVRTTLLGVVTRHPYRHLAGYFCGLAVGLALLLLISPRLTLPAL
jgi:nitrate reductase gamma subunit